MNSPEISTQFIQPRQPDVLAESIAMVTESAYCVSSLVNLVGAVVGEGLSAPTFGSQLSALSSGLGFERGTV